ncbi:MAG: hypothetical protein ACREME_07255, partial [Gemmatimonadales bacterium]
MRSLSRLAPAPAALVRITVSLAALVCFGAGVAAYAAGQPEGEHLPLTAVALTLFAALIRRYGIALPGNGFSSYVIGLMLYAILARGWAFAALVAPFAMLVGDVLLRRLPLRAALDNAAHLTVGSTLVGLLYEQVGGATGGAALTAANVGPLALALGLLPVVVNGTFYLQLSLGGGKTIAWVDARLTVRWEGIVYLVSAALALGWLALVYSGLPARPAAVIATALALATAGSLYVLRLGVRADELQLV